MNSKVLIIDDEKDICFLISEILRDENFIAESALNSDEALKKFNDLKPDLIILDVWLGKSKLDGLELLKEFKKNNSTIPIIIISGHGTVDMAVNAIKNGAYDFLEKPFNSEKILILSKRAIESAKLLNENSLLRKIIKPNKPLIGNSSFFNVLKKNLIKYSQSNSRILITGPDSSGKKLIAQNIHENSYRSQNLANIINFQNLDNDELKSMFSEEDNNINENFFVKSNNSTIILYNIDYLSVFFQKKLLNYLENDNYFNNHNIKLNLKVISISSNNITEEVEKGNFIKSLYDRINVININIPPISERREDIIPICNFYLDYFNKNKKFNFVLSKESINKLESYEWPGNVGQIINYIEKTIILNQGSNKNSDFILKELPLDMGENEQKSSSTDRFALSLKEARQNFEREYLLSQIKKFNGNISKISEFTGMERTALYRKFKSLNISFK